MIWALLPGEELFAAPAADPLGSAGGKFEERWLLVAAAGADCSQLFSCRISMARSSPGNSSCALAVTELWCLWLVLSQKRWA